MTDVIPGILFFIKTHRESVYPQIYDVSTLVAVSRVVVGRILQDFEIVLVRCVVDVQLSFDHVLPASVTIFPVSVVLICVMLSSDRISTVVAGTAVSCV